MDCKDCTHVPRIDKQLDELTKFKDRMTNRTLSRIWEGIEAKVSKSVIVTVFVVMVTFVGTLFGLVYHTQNKVLDKLDAEDLKSARKWAMVQMRTQNSSWLIRQMNGALRPFAGWMALLILRKNVESTAYAIHKY